MLSHPVPIFLEVRSQPSIRKFPMKNSAVIPLVIPIDLSNSQEKHFEKNIKI